MKSIEINMSTLSQAQKKMCVELIAQSNIKFEQKDNQYYAQIKVNSSNLQKTQQNENRQKDRAEAVKKESLPTLNGGKKFLARAVKIGDLKKLEQLHRSIEIYVYPKRMPLLTLCELIENSYEKFWIQHRKKSAQVRSISFPEWFYKHMISSLKDKLKVEQLLVNLIDSLNHFVPKEPGLKIFYHFLSGNWPTDSLFYFLVLRGILEQVTESKILEKSNITAAGGMLKLRVNPYEKVVTDEQVKIFLNTLSSGGLSCSRSKSKPLQGIYQALTQKMFWQQSKRKNYIYFFDFLEHLVLEFMDNEVSSCDMSLSKTEFGDHSMSELISEDPNNESDLFKKQPPEKAPPEIYVLELDPAEEERTQERLRQEKEVRSAESLESSVLEKLSQIYGKLKIKPSQSTLNCIQSLVSSIINLDKNIWIRYRGCEIAQSQLFAIEKVQALYRQQSELGVLTNKLLKSILLIPALRQQIVVDIGL